MEITTLVGLALGFIGLIGGMMFKGVSPVVLLNPASVFIILIGTAGALFNAFPGKDTKNIPKLFAIVFTKKKGEMDNVQIVNLIVEYAQMVRKDGILSLEPKINEVNDPFIKRSLELLMLGQGTEYIETTLSAEISSMSSRHQANALIFTQAGTYAPTLGVLGAVIGLIAALGDLSDTDALGHAISAAFVATLYGIFTGYVLWHPFANKLKRKSAYEVITKTIIIEGILSLCAGESPELIKQKLMSFLPSDEKRILTEKEG